MAKAQVTMTVDEIISTIKRTTRPTLFVEGTDDLSIFSEYGEKNYGNRKYTVQQCYGRTQLLQIYDRRNELNHNKSVTFFADQDMWVFTGIPVEYGELLVTEGYSIENDIFRHSKDEVIGKLITQSEHELFLQVINEIVQWFAYECELYVSGNECKIKVHLNEVVCEKKQRLISDFLTKRNFKVPSSEMLNKVFSDDFLRLRGKFIFEALVRVIGKRKKHKPKYGYPELFDLCITFAQPQMKEYFNRVFNTLFPPSDPSTESVVLSEIHITSQQSAASGT